MAYLLVNIHAIKDIQSYQISTKGYLILVEASAKFNDAIQLIQIPREMLSTEHVQVFPTSEKNKWDYKTKPIAWFHGLHEYFYEGSPKQHNVNLKKQTKSNFQKKCR